MRIALLVVMASMAAGLTAQQRPAFDVASVKISPPIGGINTFVGMRIDPGRVHIANFGLNALLMRAFGVEGDQAVGIPNEFRYPLSYEIDATFPAEASKDQVPLCCKPCLPTGSNWWRIAKQGRRRSTCWWWRRAGRS